MARLRVTDIDTVEQQDDLVLCAPSDGDVRLGSDGERRYLNEYISNNRGSNL